MGLSLDSSNNTVSSQAFEDRKGLVGDEKTSDQGVPTVSRRVTKNLNWTLIFEERPDLKPPGYEEAAKATKIAIENRKLRQQGSQTAKPAPKKSRKRRR